MQVGNINVPHVLYAFAQSEWERYKRKTLLNHISFVNKIFYWSVAVANSFFFFTVDDNSLSNVLSVCTWTHTARSMNTTVVCWTIFSLNSINRTRNGSNLQIKRKKREKIVKTDNKNWILLQKLESWTRVYADCGLQTHLHTYYHSCI